MNIREPRRLIHLATKATFGHGKHKWGSRLGWMITDGELEPTSPRTFAP